MIWWRFALACVAVGGGALFYAAPVFANQTQFEQTIKPLDCTLTELSNGSGTVINSDCPPQPALIDSVQTKNGRLAVIFGRYDAANIRIFKVRFNGVWYQLGVDRELTAKGNMWQLDLTTTEPPLTAGRYTVDFEELSYSGSTIMTSTVITIQPLPSQPPVITPVTPLPPNTGLRAFVQSYVVPSFFVLIFAASIGAVGYCWHLRRRIHR